MRTICLLLLLCLLGGCSKDWQAISSAYNKVLNHAKVEPPRTEGALIVLEAEVKELYPTDDFRRVCPYAVFNYNAADAVMKVTIKCNPDSIKVLQGLPKQIVTTLMPKQE